MKYILRTASGAILSLLYGGFVFAYSPTIVDRILIDGVESKINTLAERSPSKLKTIGAKIEILAASQTEDSREKYIIDSILELVYNSMNTIDEKTNWATFSSDGLHISYPNDGTYSIEIPKNHIPGTQLNHFIITQKYPGQRIHISLVDKVIQTIRTQKTINERNYDMFYAVAMTDGYGYVTEYNGKKVIFRSLYNQENETFEQIMQTVRFDKTSPFTDQTDRKKY